MGLANGNQPNLSNKAFRILFRSSGVSITGVGFSIRSMLKPKRRAKPWALPGVR